MKKLLVLLALCMVLSVALVACTEDPAGPEETTPEVTTDPTTDPGSDDPTTEEPTTDPGSDDPTTEEPTTDPGSESETDPEPPKPVKVVYAKSWDSLTKVPSGEAVFSSGEEYLTWENNAVAEVGLNDVALHVYGWVAYTTETEGTVGYKINDGEVVYGEGFTDKAESGVQDYIATLDGCKSACRMHFDIPVANLAAGEYTVALYAKDPDGNEELIKEFKLTKTLPFVGSTDCADFKGWSFDGFYLNDELYFEQDGNAASKLEAINNRVPFEYGTFNYNVGFRGWVSFAQTVDSFGYYIVGTSGDIVYDEFKQERPDLVQAGIENGTGYNIVVPVMDLGYGDHLVGFVAKLADGTVVRLYEITIEVKNLVVDTETNFMVSIDHVNGSGPVKEDGTFEPNFNAIGGLSMGKIDASVAGKTSDKNGVLTFGGWCGVPGGVNRYVWSIDGVNWMEVVSGGVDGEPLPGHYNSLNTEEGMTSTKNGMFHNGTAPITIQLPAEWAGAQGTIYVGAIPELNQGSVIVICELSNFTVGPMVEEIWYNGENGTFTVPANFETKFLIRFGVGQTIKIENAFNYAITATNVYTGESATLQANVLGVIEQVIPEGWDLVELTIANVTAEPSEITVQLLEPAPTTAPLVIGENVVNAIVTPSGWNDVTLVYFTAPAAGTYYFTLSSDYASGSLYYADAPIYGMVEEFPLVLTLEEGQTVELGVSADVIIGDLAGATEDIVYGVGLIISDQAPVEAPEAVTSLEIGTAYTISASNKDGLLYVTGNVTSGRFDGSFDIADAAIFYVEASATEGEYLLYFMDGDTKTYVVMGTKSAGGSLTTDAAAATSYVWNTEVNTLVASSNRAFGAQNTSTYANLSTYSITNISDPIYNWGAFCIAD